MVKMTLMLMAVLQQFPDGYPSHTHTRIHTHVHVQQTIHTRVEWMLIVFR